MLRYVEERDELLSRLRIIDGWFAVLSPLERLGADYWLLRDDGTIAAVAEASGLDWHQARQLVHSIPLIIWGRCYYPERNDARTLDR